MIGKILWLIIQCLAIFIIALAAVNIVLLNSQIWLIAQILLVFEIMLGIICMFVGDE